MAAEHHVAVVVVAAQHVAVVVVAAQHVAVVVAAAVEHMAAADIANRLDAA
jgi:hypothetical protein